MKRLLAYMREHERVDYRWIVFAVEMAGVIWWFLSRSAVMMLFLLALLVVPIPTITAIVVWVLKNMISAAEELPKRS